MVNSKQKGKRGELEAAAELRRLSLGDARRTQQFCGTEGDADLVGVEGFHLEVKRQETVSLYPWMEQAMSDAKEGQIPMVLLRKSRKPWLAVIPLDSLPDAAVKIFHILCSEDQPWTSEDPPHPPET